MAGCDKGFVEIDEKWTQEKALRKYSSHKNWYTKYITQVQNLKELNDKAYDSRVEEELNKNITKAENTAACLGQVNCYLTKVGYEQWEDHQKEVDDMDKEVAAEERNFCQGSFEEPSCKTQPFSSSSRSR